MAWWLVREKQVPPLIVELLEEATQRLVRQEIRHAHSVEPAAACLAVEEPPAQATLRRVTRPRALLVQPEQQSDRLARAFFAPGRRP